MSEPTLPFDDVEPIVTADLKVRTTPATGVVQAFRPAVADALPDADARRRAVDPAANVMLEASAGTGKTRVLVERYVNLLLAGVEPANILAITFTRKAAAEMRERIIARLREASVAGELTPARWRALRERLSDIAISTIDAFCLSLIREFPLEADVDPGFDLADETEIPRLLDEALDSTLRIGRHLARTDADVAMLFVQLGERRLRAGLGTLLDRRLVAGDILRRFLDFGPRDLTPAIACRRAATRLRDALASIDVRALVESGPLGHLQFAMLAADVASLCDPSRTFDAAFDTRDAQAAFRSTMERVRAYFLTQDGQPRKASGFGQSVFRKEHCRSEVAWKQHREAVETVAGAVAEAVRAFRRDVNAILSRGVWRIFQIGSTQYVRTLERHGVLDFSEVLARAVDLLRRMDEFSRSRYKLEARYRHVLVDELQDTSRPQWELVSLLVRSWGEGAGASSDALPPSIFVVGDRKQSIYAFRDADVAVLNEAAAFIDALRPGSGARQAISTSFRAVPALLAFINDVFADIAPGSDGRTGFRYSDADRFPVAAAGEPPVGYIAADTVEAAADRVGDEVVRLLEEGTIVRDKHTGLSRLATAADVAILFRSRDSHRAYETALERRGIATYVYKGLGFFDADEVQDAMAVLRFLAEPTSNSRAAAFMRSRLVRLSDVAMARLAPALAETLLREDGTSARAVEIDEEDRQVLSCVRAWLPRWLGLVDRLTPSELLDVVLRESAYAYELRGSRRIQARENLKKLRALVRKIQNRGYATLARIADHLDQLALGDESNAVVDAAEAVHLMTVHAAKGLEFPVVFVVNLGRGTGGPRAPIRVVTSGSGSPSVAIGDFDGEGDDEASTREREETKRLLYVALTRARDRLYLSGVVKNGVFRPGRGSLGEVLPRSIVQRLETSAADSHLHDRALDAPAR